jgi:hypothetical protein
MEHYGADLEMAFPTRRRGLRSITVNGTVFRWRFTPGEKDSILIVYGHVTGCQALKVHLGSWLEWLGMYFPRAESQLPKIILPDFTRQAIESGLAGGWTPDEKGVAFEMEWKDEGFSVPSTSAN